MYMIATILDALPDAKAKAEEAAYAAWISMRAARDKRGMAASLVLLGKCVAAKGEYGNAVQKLEEALFLYRGIKDLSMEAKTLLEMADVMARDPSKRGEDDLQV